LRAGTKVSVTLGLLLRINEANNLWFCRGLSILESERIYLSDVRKELTRMSNSHHPA
jgi:hypothetical protein